MDMPVVDVDVGMDGRERDLRAASLLLLVSRRLSMSCLAAGAGIVQGLGGLGAIGSAAQGIGNALGFGGGGIYRSGGLVSHGYRYRGGGLADFEPQYYDMYER